MYHIHKLAKEAADNYQSYYLKNIHCNVNVTIDKKNLAKKEWSNSNNECIKAQKVFERAYSNYSNEKGQI